MKSKYRNLVVVAAFILTASCFMVMAQDQPSVPTDDQTVGELEQELTELQNRIWDLKSNSAQQPVNNNVPMPADDSSSRLQSNASASNSVYPRNLATRPLDPTAGLGPQAGYNQLPPAQPWGAEPPTYVVHQQVERIVPVQVPVFVEPPPYVHYEPVCNQYLPPAIGLEFFFSGNGDRYKHNKHRH